MVKKILNLMINDKALHFVYTAMGAFATSLLVSSGRGLIISTLIWCGIAYGKELYDKKGNGTYDLKDFYVSCLGAVLVSLSIYLKHYA
jgi:hypothetical protein